MHQLKLSMQQNPSIIQNQQFMQQYTNIQSILQNIAARQLNCQSNVIQRRPTTVSILKETPLTIEILKNVEPSEQKRLIGERLFPKVHSIEPRLAVKITERLLDMNVIQLLPLLSAQNMSVLVDKIKQILIILKTNHNHQ
eukprot:154254_1